MPKKQALKQTVWMVSTGSYSDYSVVAVCSTRERAEAMREFCNGNEPVEYVLDEEFRFFGSGRLLWQVWMHRDGESPDAYRCDSTTGADDGNWRKDKARWVSPGSEPESLHGFYVWAKDEQHAIKIANERRAQLIAEGLW